MQEVLIDGESGLLVWPEDSAGLSAALRRMIDDAPLRERCAAQASALVRRECNEAPFLERVAGLIEQTALEERRRSA